MYGFVEHTEGRDCDYLDCGSVQFFSLLKMTPTFTFSDVYHLHAYIYKYINYLFICYVLFFMICLYQGLYGGQVDVSHPQGCFCFSYSLFRIVQIILFMVFYSPCRFKSVFTVFFLENL